MKHLLGRLLAATSVVAAVGASTAQAAPVTVNLRIEGPTSTLFDGNVTTDVRQFHFTGDATMHQCDGTSFNGGSSSTAVPTAGGAVAAAIDGGLSATGSWYNGAGFAGPSFNVINGTNVSYDGASGKYLVEYKNGAYATVGACADQLRNNDQVLFAYGLDSDIALSLTGPVNANVGETVPVVVRNAANNVGQGGASVGGSTTNSDGVANLTFAGAGVYTLKAEKPGAIRSNAINVCIHNGNDGNCGYPLDPSTPLAPVAPTVEPTAPAVPTTPTSPVDTAAPVAKIEGLRSAQKFAKGKGPRELKGSIADSSSLKNVEIRLRRQSGRSCFSFSGKAEKFTKIGCKADASWFSIGTDADWSYLLPSKLPSGLYQLQVRATDTSGNTSGVESLRFRVA